jgi:hypothetical protein
MMLNQQKRITREMLKGWAETYDEAIDALLWVANDGYDQDDLIESIEIYYDEEMGNE